MRTCLKKDHENGKNAKMNSSTQKPFTLKNVWKIIFKKMTQKLMIFQVFYVESSKQNGVFNGGCLETSKN